MNNQCRRAVLRLGLIPMLAVIIVTAACWGRHLADLSIENQTNQVLTIILDEMIVGRVQPGAVINNDFDIGFSEYLIEAKNAQGEIVFSQSYVFKDFQKIGDGTYKVVIPPLTKTPESSNNVTGE